MTLDLSTVVGYQTAAIQALDAAQKVLDDWEEMCQGETRWEDGGIFHAVNVKRHFGEDLDEGDDIPSDAWEFFIECAWNDLNLSVQDYDWLKVQMTWQEACTHCDVRIAQFGRMGGWACFQTIYDRDVQDELEEQIAEVQSLLNGGSSMYAGLPPSEGGLSEAHIVELERLTSEMKDGIVKIVDLKNFIDQYNRNLSMKRWWEDWKEHNG